MYRSSPARKYGPLALLAAVQLVVVLAAPSTAPSATDTAFSAGTSPFGSTGSVVDPATGAVLDPAALPEGATVTSDGSIVAADGTVLAPAGSAPVPGGSGTAGAPAASGGGGGGAAAPVAAAGDTSHCVDGRQYDPAIDYFAPPCAAGKPGVVGGVENGGATSFGVTAEKITIAQYIPDYGAEVNAILQAQGLYYDAETAAPAAKAYQDFLNAKYQLYGRQFEVKLFQGTCRTVPPDLQCLLPEMNRMVDTLKPYAVFFQTTVCSQCFAELARRKVVTFGGAGFSEEFRNALKPFNYDTGMSSTKMAKLFAQLWCGNMAGKNAVFASPQNPQQDFRQTKRRLGIVSTNDPDNERVVKQVLYPELAKCGESVDGREYFYEQNVATAAQQSQAGTAVMNRPNDPATSVVCFCDPVAPQFSYNAAKRNNYWPETLLATNQAMDTDSAGQSYVSTTLACQGGGACSFDGALGLGTAEPAVPGDQLSGVKVFRQTNKGALPLAPPVMEIFWQNYNMIGSLVTAAGPNLNPGTMAAGAPKLGSRGGGDTGRTRRAFENGELSWTQDAHVTWFQKGKKSAYNGVAGTFNQAYGGRRFGLGQLPGGDLQVPTVDKR